MIDEIELIGKIKERINAHGEYDAENDVYTIENAVEESEIDNLADEIADEFIAVLSPIVKRLDALKKEADERTKDLPEEKTDEEQDSTATDEEKEIVCRPGYHEWNVFHGDKIVFAFGDVTEELDGGNEEITDDDIEIVAYWICEEHRDEIDETGLNRKEVQHAIEKALGEHYGVVMI